jgi:hypothetical protein
MTRFSVIESVRHLIEQYRSFIKSSYRLADRHSGRSSKGTWIAPRSWSKGLM